MASVDHRFVRQKCCKIYYFKIRLLKKLDLLGGQIRQCITLSANCPDD